MATIGDALKSRENNFDAIRLVAALCVLHSHCFDLLGLPTDDFRAWTGYSGGGIGVGAFFIISGFLVTASVQKRDMTSYFMSRFLRIFPALLVVTLATVFIIGAAFTTLPLLEYLGAPQTAFYLKNPAIFELQYALPGVFTSNPAITVNGSLWTLPLEVLCYLCLPWLYLLGLLKKPSILVLVALLSAAVVAMAYLGMSEADPTLIAGRVPLFVFLRYAIYFLSGSIFYVMRNEIPLSGGLALTSFVMLYAASWLPRPDWAFIPALGYIVLYLALAKPCTGWLHRYVGDLSYGTYIWAFPIQQSLIALTRHSIGPYTLSAIAMPTVLVIAYMSWRFVEKPALALKSRFGGRDRHPPMLQVACDREAA